MDEDFPGQGIHLVVEGAEPALVRQTLDTRMQDLLHQQGIGYQMSIAAMGAVQSREDPKAVAEKMRRLYEE